MQLRTNLRRPNRYREDDVPELPPNPIFVVPTIPYDPALRPAAFPTLSLDQNPPDFGAENPEENSTSDETTRRRAFVFRDQRTVPMYEPIDGLVQLPNGRWVATDEPGEYDGYNALDWNVDDNKNEDAPQERWFPPGAVQRLDWRDLSNGMQLVIIKELTTFIPFLDSVQFLCLEEEDIKCFIRLCQAEIRIRENEENRIARTTERQMDMLMSGNWSAGNPEWEAILQQELFGGVDAMETPATFLISRNQIEDAKAFLMDFRTREEFPEENGPPDEDINNIPTYEVMQEILCRLDSYLGVDLSFQELNYGDEILNYFPPDDGQPDLLASYEAALGVAQEEEAPRGEVPEQVWILPPTISKPLSPMNKSVKKDKDAITFGSQPISEKKPRGVPLGGVNVRNGVLKARPSRLREVVTAEDLESESQDSPTKGQGSSELSVDPPHSTEESSCQTPLQPVSTRKVSSVGRNPFVEHSSTNPPPQHTAAFHMGLPAQPAPPSPPKASRSSTSPPLNKPCTVKPISPSGLVQIAQSTLHMTSPSPVSTDTRYTPFQVTPSTTSHMTQSNHFPPPKTSPAWVSTSCPVESPVTNFHTSVNHAPQSLQSPPPASSPTPQSSSTTNTSSPSKNPKLKINFKKNTSSTLPPQPQNVLNSTQSETSTVPQRVTAVTSMGTSQGPPSSTTPPNTQKLKQSISSITASTAIPSPVTKKTRTEGRATILTGEEQQFHEEPRINQSDPSTTTIYNKVASSAPTSAKRPRTEELNQSLQAEQPAAKRSRLEGTQGGAFASALMKGAKAIGNFLTGKSDSESGSKSPVGNLDAVSDLQEELETPLDMPNTPSQVHLSKTAMNFGKGVTPSPEKAYQSPYQQCIQSKELVDQPQYAKSVGSYVMEEVVPDDSKRLGAPPPILEEKTRAATKRARNNSESSATDSESSRASTSPSQAKVARNQARGTSIQVLVPKCRVEEISNSTAPKSPAAKKQKISRASSASAAATSPATTAPRARGPTKQMAGSATNKSTAQSNTASQPQPRAKHKSNIQPEENSQSQTAPQAEGTSQMKPTPNKSTRPKASSLSKSTNATATKSKAKQGPNPG